MREALSFRSWRHRPFLIASFVLGIALLLALAGPHGVTNRTPAPQPRPPAVAMVATHPLTAGSVITAADISAKAYANTMPVGAMGSPNAALGRVAARNFAAGEPLRGEDLRDAPAGIGVRVPVGERAFAIRVTEDEIVGGFLQSGDHVDLFATIPGSVFPAMGAQNLPDRSQSVLLLQNVQVLAVGENPATKGSVQANARTVSLSLPPDKLARLNLALRFGKISLAIRRPGDDGVAGTAAATLADLIPSQAGPVTATAATPDQSRGIPFYAGTRVGTVSGSKGK